MQPDVTKTHQQQYINTKRSKDETINNSFRTALLPSLAAGIVGGGVVVGGLVGGGVGTGTAEQTNT